MTPAQFIARWKGSPLSERAGAQSYFNDLCAMLGVPTPNDTERYCFERGWAAYMPDMPDEEILRRLLALNLERKAAERT